ncbi:TetR/AcrR family transcriptional regulator [Limnohabitans sp.]|uniref:TetR/AcrR family transcriptional regulator n=1 Tax=Limnohabitans sp. TaxID=1907725 RepID=UPI0039BCA565|nr:TetR/AcrR family transcriptional regulator [Comamonadaceae bacterium]
MKTITKPAPKAKKPSKSVSATTVQTKDSESGLIVDRRAELIEKAALLFGARGYANTSMRDISAAFGILHGSIYHHFGSKEELFITVYASGVDRFVKDVEKAIEPYSDPWQRLEVACIAHLEALLMRESPAATVLADWSANYSESMRTALVAQRDRYEKVFLKLTDAVELPQGIKKRYFRLGLLGALNGALMWYQPGGDSPATVAKQLFSLFRKKAESTDI